MMLFLIYPVAVRDAIVYVKDLIVWGCSEIIHHYYLRNKGAPKREDLHRKGGVEEQSVNDLTDHEQVEVKFSKEEQVCGKFTVISNKQTDNQNKKEGTEVQDDSLETAATPIKSLTSFHNSHRTPDNMIDQMSLSASPAVVPL